MSLCFSLCALFWFCLFCRLCFEATVRAFACPNSCLFPILNIALTNLFKFFVGSIIFFFFIIWAVCLFVYSSKTRKAACHSHESKQILINLHRIHCHKFNFVCLPIFCYPPLVGRTELNENSFRCCCCWFSFWYFLFRLSMRKHNTEREKKYIKNTLYLNTFTSSHVI